MVTIGCKLPAGHILHLNPGQPNERSVKLNGANTARIAGGYGFTEVEKDFWDAWIKRNASMQFIVGGMIFCTKSERDAEAVAKERESERSGFEPVDPKKAPAGIQPAA